MPASVLDEQTTGNVASTSLVTLSLISHTNAGKTSLARTLLRRDVGEVRDAPHVTLFNESHTLISEKGHVLRLWDTPGFGDSTRLLKRLKREGNPVLWFLTQTWDRFTDKPLWCSQQALKNVREEADVVLYLVNAGEPPEFATYLESEMEILGWVKKPVLVLLNQTGASGLSEEEMDQWKQHLTAYPQVLGALSMDAFARFWVQEDALMDAIAGLLPEPKQACMRVLQKAWHQRNVDVFDEAMQLLGRLLSNAVSDGVEVRTESILERVGIGRSEINKEYADARQSLAVGLAEHVEVTTDSLIRLHGLEGKAGMVATQAMQSQFHKAERISESIWGVLGSFAGGAMGGLLADLKMGGMTFGVGAVFGGLATGLTTYAVIRSYNLVRGGDEKLHWSKEHFREQVRLAILCYLAVAHFGRGRGVWQDAEQPLVWREKVESITAAQAAGIEHLWKLGVEKNANPAVTTAEAVHLVKRLTQAVLAELYPGFNVRRD